MYWRGSSQIGQASGGFCAAGYCVPHALQTQDDRAAISLDALEEGDTLDVGCVREHVHGPRPHEPVAVLLGEALCVACEGGRVAGDVDDPRRGDLAESLQRLAREPGTRRIDDHDVRVSG